MKKAVIKSTPTTDDETTKTKEKAEPKSTPTENETTKKATTKSTSTINDKTTKTKQKAKQNPLLLRRKFQRKLQQNQHILNFMKRKENLLRRKLGRKPYYQ